jgi:tetratricopeptide (TPR) repeat protein
LEVYRQGVVFNEARGLAGLAIWIGASLLDALADSGELDEVLTTAGRLAERAEMAGIIPPLLTARGVQARVLALRGEPEKAAPFLKWLEDSSRETGAPEEMVLGLASAAIARTALGHVDRAAELLDELATTPQVGAARGSFPAWVCPMVRAALQLGDQALAERIAGSVEPMIPYAEHALVAANAALTEARGDRQAAADAYTDATGRWKRFGVVTEHAFALLGQGRCLVELSRQNEAAPVLQHAREIFERLRAAPALAETDALMQQAIALSS